MDPILLIPLLAAGLALAVWSFLRERKRRRLLRSFARSQGLAYHGDRRTGWEREYPGLPVLDRGRDRHTRLHLAGARGGRRVRCLDYRFTTGSGKNRKVHRRSLVVLDVGAPVVPLTIRPENLLDRVGEFLGLDDLDFESAAFSRRFHVSSADRKWAYAVIHPRMMEELMRLPDGVTVVFGLGEVAVRREGSLQARHCHRDLRAAERILDLVPDDVLAELRGETP